MFKGREFVPAQDRLDAVTSEINNLIEARRAQRLLWAVVAGFILLNAVIVYFALRPGMDSAEGNSELPATTNVLQSASTNHP